MRCGGRAPPTVMRTMTDSKEQAKIAKKSAKAAAKAIKKTGQAGMPLS